MSLDNISFVGMSSLGVFDNCEPAAWMLSTVSDDFTSIVLLIHEDTESLIVGLGNKGHLVSVLENLELLGCISFVVIYGELVLIGNDGECFVVVKDRYDPVVSVRDWGELGSDSLVLSLLLSRLLVLSLLLTWLNLLCSISWDDGPNLVMSSMEGPLEDLVAIDHIGSSNIKSFTLRESHDMAGLTSQISSLNLRDLEKTTFVLSSI